jgi:hypothetical protein
MAQDQTTFNEAAYLAAYPDVARALGQPGVESAFDHYQNYGRNEGRQGFFVEPQQEQAAISERNFNEAAYLAQNPDVARAIGQPGVKSAYDHYINFGQNEGRKASFDVSESTARINELSNEIYDAYKYNQNYDAQYKELQSLKDKDPQAYYNAQLKFLGQQVGWQIGQNTNERSAPAREQIQGLIPEAIKAGVSASTIDSILNTSVNTANIENQQRIINEQQSGGSGFNLGELVRGVLPIAALAIGAPFLDAALAAGAAGASAATAGAAGGTAAGTGITGGAGASGGLLASGGTVGSLAGAGSAAGIAGTQALAGLGIAGGSALPALGMATGGFPSTVGQLSAALPAPGSVGGAGLGLSAELAPGTILGSGLPGGGAIGASYALGANGLPATGLFGQPIPASSIGFGSIPETVTAASNLGIKDVLDAARLGKSLLGGGAAQPQQQAAAQMPQNIMPRGQVDYSGILNLLQVPSPQRNMYSLLG